MSNEASKALKRRLRDPVWATHYMRGDAIDIGAGRDGLSRQREHWPGLTSVREWDVQDGDAMLMAGVPDESYDLVHSSHCLEHMVDPWDALFNWWRLVRPGGHLVVIVPDEEMYEQGVWPSTFNSDHKWSFVMQGAFCQLPKSVSVMEMVTMLNNTVPPARAELLELRRLHATFDWSRPREDQTLGDAESAIEFVVRKRP